MYGHNAVAPLLQARKARAPARHKASEEAPRGKGHLSPSESVTHAACTYTSLFADEGYPMRSQCAIFHTFLPFLVLCFRSRVKIYEFLLVKFRRHQFVERTSIIPERSSKL